VCMQMCRIRCVVVRVAVCVAECAAMYVAESDAVLWRVVIRPGACANAPQHDVLLYVCVALSVAVAWIVVMRPGVCKCAAS